jgi:hypothetical protein
MTPTSCTITAEDMGGGRRWGRGLHVLVGQRLACAGECIFEFWVVMVGR